MLRAQPDLPLQLLLDALVGGCELSYDPRQLEHTLVTGADTHRAGGTWRAVPAAVEAFRGRAVVGGPAGWHWGAEGEAAAGEVMAGPGSVGSFVRLNANPDRTPIGPSFAPAAVAFWSFADRELGTGVGPLRAAGST
jgi:hypothetical protein